MQITGLFFQHFGFLSILGLLSQKKPPLTDPNSQNYLSTIQLTVGGQRKLIFSVKVCYANYRFVFSTFVFSLYLRTVMHDQKAMFSLFFLKPTGKKCRCNSYGSSPSVFFYTSNKLENWSQCIIGWNTEFQSFFYLISFVSSKCFTDLEKRQILRTCGSFNFSTK